MNEYLLTLAGAAKTKAEAGSILLADRIDAILPQTQCGKCGYSASARVLDKDKGGDNFGSDTRGSDGHGGNDYR